MNDKSTNKVYVLELIGDIVNTPGSVVLEVGGVSTDKEILETLKREKDEELNEEFGEEKDSDDDDSDVAYFSDEDEDDFGDCEYMGYDLTGRPEWTITEYDLLTKK